MTTNKLNINEKQKNEMMQKIFADYPDAKRDSLQSYYIEKLVESYLVNPDEFNRKTTEWKKQEKKGKLPEPKKVPEEVVCIEKIAGEEPVKEAGNFIIDNHGMINSA
jgi:hypothetical protein